MATISEDYVSFETAKLLKEKGFNCPSYYHYRLNNGELCNFNTNCNTNLKQNDYITAPTLQMVMKWLREVYKLSVRPRYDEVEDEKGCIYHEWFFDILSMKPYKMLTEPKQGYPTYENTCEAAIKYCLENLI